VDGESPIGAVAPAAGLEPKLRDPDAARKAAAYVAALGGKENIVRVDACAETRLRLVVRDEQKIDDDKLKAAGIAAVVRLPNKTCHLLAGRNADQYAAEMRGQLAARKDQPIPFSSSSRALL
jgi:PTS system glucose-specific IIC component